MAQTELIRVGHRPSALARFVQALRSFTIGPFNLKDPALTRYFGGGGPVSSGIYVNEESALTAAAVWAAVTLISDDVSSLPLMLFRRLPNGGKERYDDHRLYSLLHDEPNPEMSSMVLRRTMQAHALIWQNAYAEIERDSAGRAAAIWPLVPESITPYRERGVLRYRYTNPENGRDIEFDARDILHLVGRSHDGSVGSSLVAKARESIGLALAAEKFGGSFFGNGATFGGIISFPGAKPSEMGDKDYRESLNARHQGVERAHKLLALYNGAKYEPMGVPPNHAQFLETRVFQVREVARWFKVPPHKLADLADATFSNVEQQNIDYFTSCLRPWLVLWEQELSRKLIARLERRIQFIEHETHGLLKADAQGRASLYTAEFQVGAVTPNDIRGYENRNPVEGGDRAFVPMNMIPLDRVDDWINAQITAKTTPKPAPAAPNQAENERTIAELRAKLVTTEAAAAEANAEVERLTDVASSLIDDVATANVGKNEADALRVKAEGALEHAVEQRAIAESQLKDVQDRLVIVEAESFGLAARLDTVTAERDEAQADAKAFNLDRAKYFEKASDLGRKVKELEAAVEGAMVERDAFKGEAERRAEIERGLLEDLAKAQDERHEALTLMALNEGVSEAAEARARTAEEQRAAAEQARQDAEQAFETQRVELASAKDAAIAEKDAAVVVQRKAEADAVAALQLAEQATRDKATAERARQDAEQAFEDQRQREVERAGAVISAHRALVVDILQRVITKETDRARRHQATPQKLAAWASVFYADHVQAVADALLPAVRLQCAWMRDDTDPLSIARQLAQAHVKESVRDLDHVRQVEDFRGHLERMLQRWEAQRPDVMADRFVREGVSHVGNS